MTAAKPKKTKPEPKPMGRPSSYTPEIAEEICERLAKGESLRTICEGDKHTDGEWMPGETTVRRWLSGREEWNEDFRRQYAHAREAQADAKFDEAWTIAQAATPDNVQVARLQVDTIKWQTGKLAPKKYGDKVLAEITGADGGAIEVNDSHAAAKLAAILASAQARRDEAEDAS